MTFLRYTLMHYLYAAIGYHRHKIGKFGNGHVIVCLIAIAAAVARHVVVEGDPVPYVFGISCFLLAIGLGLGVRIMVLYAMLSTVTDVVALSLYPVVGPISLMLWEATVFAVLVGRNLSFPKE